MDRSSYRLHIKAGYLSCWQFIPFSAKKKLNSLSHPVDFFNCKNELIKVGLYVVRRLFKTSYTTQTFMLSNCNNCSFGNGVLVLRSR